VTKAELVSRRTKPRGFNATLRAEFALARGDVAEARRQLAAARDYFGTLDVAPQHHQPLERIEIQIAAAEGRLLDARATLEQALDSGFRPGTQFDVWPLLLAAAVAETQAIGLPVADADRPKILDRIREAAKPVATNVPVWRAHERWLRAELLHADGRGTPDDWSEAVEAFECLDRPYDLARVRHRLAEALLSDSGGGDDERDRATELLRLAAAVAEHLGARPLADSVALLAQRARLTLTRVPARRAVPADPVEALGLTSRERDVLRLVSAGRTNRQIAEELFISPKTASVHVSNILGKLGVSGRGEAAALAHRLELFPPDPLTVRSAR
jgi:DNA-binding CsgD family transcriptional regulator